MQALPSVAPRVSGPIEFFPGARKSWAYSFLVNDEPAPTGRAAGSLGWGGLGNLYFWIDRATGVAGFWASQASRSWTPPRSAAPSRSRPRFTTALRARGGCGQSEAMSNTLENISVGMEGEAEVVVTPEITVGGNVPGMPMVYGTPFMILLMEVASGNAIRAHLPEGFVSVGSHVDVRHLAPTPLGRKVIARARVIEKTRTSVLFEVQAFDGERLIGEGKHRRGIVYWRGFGEQSQS